MDCETFAIPGPVLITPKRHGDNRGFFSEVFRDDVWRLLGVNASFVQDNHSYSKGIGILRGLHFQIPPAAQGKLVRVTRGCVLDVIVDVRTGSPTYGQHIAVELSADNWQQLWVPEGFAHGFCSLSDEVEFLYKVTSHYSPECDSGIAYNDPDLGIDWPFPADKLTLSEKDRKLGRLKDLGEVFKF